MNQKGQSRPPTRRDRLLGGVLIGGFIAFVLGYAGYLMYPSIASDCGQQRALERGVTAEATILDVQDTGNRFNDNPEARITLNVKPPRGNSFDAEVLYVMSPVEAVKFTPGKKIEVKYDPQDHENVAIVSVPW